MKAFRFVSLACCTAVLAVGSVSCVGEVGDEAESEQELSQEDVEGFNAAYEENASGKADSAGCSGVIVPDRKGFQKRIAITFDDGPKGATTPEVLKILAAHKAKATFFVNGKGIGTPAQKTLLKQMSDAGHFIGNHSQNHLNLSTLSADKVKAEAVQTQKLLSDLGIKQRYFRFPFGAATCSAASTVRSLGYAITGWHIDSADWCYAAGGGYCKPATFKYVEDQYRNNITGYILSQVAKTGGGVLLFHDIHPYTVSKLDEVLTALEGKGYSFVGLDDTSTFPLLNGTTAPVEPWIGAPCKDDAGCKFSSAGASGYCFKYGTQGFCSLPCNGYCPDKTGTAPTFCTSLDKTHGMCVSKSASANQLCAGLAGTSPTTADRFIGTSTASATQATVCLPK